MLAVTCSVNERDLIQANTASQLIPGVEGSRDGRSNTDRSANATWRLEVIGEQCGVVSHKRLVHTTPSILRTSE